jgi:hypothetical protein
MTMQSLSEYQKAAAARWPQYRIHGDGPHALVCPTSYSVTLFGYWLEAASEMMNDHANWRCKDSHKLVEIKPAPQRTPVPRNFADRLERA